MNILSSERILVINYSNAFFGKNITFNAKLVKVNVNLSLYLIKPHTTEAYKVVEVQFHTFLTSALDGVSIYLHVLVTLWPEKWSYKLLSIQEKLCVINMVDTS